MSKIVSRVVVVCALCVPVIANHNGYAQTTMLPSLVETLAHPVQPPAVTRFQLQSYLMHRIPPLPLPSTPEQWTGEVNRLRKHILDEVAFHGWPREWVESAPNFEETGVIESGHGYRIRKLRYEIVPGFVSTALLYQPEGVSGRVPAVLNVIGHEPDGIAVEYEQMRCINLAKRGMVALNLGWMGFGELSQHDNAHDYAAHLDLAGSNAPGLFYLAMRRGLHYLASLPEVDPTRIGVTGLSGGGWQTVLLGALDPRVAVSVEVAGVASKESNLTNPQDTYEIEEDAPDLMQRFDYPEFIAMRAPKPTLLVHNAVDSCCFRAPLVKPYIYEFGFSNDLSATGILLQENTAPANQPAVIVLNDKGYGFAGEAVANHVDRGQQVLALNLLLYGPSAPGPEDPTDWAMLADASGSRPLGLEVAHLISAAEWFRSTSGVAQINVETDGYRSQLIALTAAAIQPDLFSVIDSRNAIHSLAFLLETPVPIRSAPELFCLDLYKYYDVDMLEAMASPVKITWSQATSKAGPWKVKHYLP